MSTRVQKLKHVMLAERGAADFQPPGPNQQFARVVQVRGNNLHEVEPAQPFTEPEPHSDDDHNSSDHHHHHQDDSAPAQTPPPPPSSSSQTTTTFLVSMPNKFRKNIWVRRGSFVVIEMIAEGKKVKAEITRILLPEHVRQFQKDGIWPAKFADKREETLRAERDANRALQRQAARSKRAADASASESESESDLERNTNGWRAANKEETTTMSSSEEEEDEVDENDVEDVLK